MRCAPGPGAAEVGWVQGWEPRRAPGGLQAERWAGEPGRRLWVLQTPAVGLCKSCSGEPQQLHGCGHPQGVGMGVSWVGLGE